MLWLPTKGIYTVRFTASFLCESKASIHACVYLNGRLVSGSKTETLVNESQSGTLINCTETLVTTPGMQLITIHCHTNPGDLVCTHRRLQVLKID